MWRVVAARDFSVRLRDKGFVISTIDHALRPVGLHLAQGVFGRSRLVRARVRGGPIGRRSRRARSATERAWTSRWSASRTLARRTPRCARGGSTRSSKAASRTCAQGPATLRVLRGSAGSARSTRARRGDRAPDRRGVVGCRRRRMRPSRDLKDQHPLDCLADPASRSGPGRQGGGRLRRRLAALRAALRLRDLGGHGSDRGEELPRRRGAPVGDPGPAADGRARSPGSACWASCS